MAHSFNRCWIRLRLVSWVHQSESEARSDTKMVYGWVQVCRSVRFPRCASLVWVLWGTATAKFANHWKPQQTPLVCLPAGPNLSERTSERSLNLRFVKHIARSMPYLIPCYLLFTAVRSDVLTHIQIHFRNSFCWPLDAINCRKHRHKSAVSAANQLVWQCIDSALIVLCPLIPITTLRHCSRHSTLHSPPDSARPQLTPRSEPKE